MREAEGPEPDPSATALDPAQPDGADMDPATLRSQGAAVVEWIAGHLDRIDALSVRSPGAPSDDQAPSARLPVRPEPFTALLADLEGMVVEELTRSHHPSFHADSPTTGSGAGVLAEALVAAVNVDGSAWTSSPVAAQLEEIVTTWVRALIGLPDTFRGMLTDSASMATLLALAAAREATGYDIRQRGLAGRTDVPLLRIYASALANPSVETAAVTLGLGRDAVRSVSTDALHRMDPEALAEAMREDARFGYHPMAVVATVGTGAAASIDPVDAIADVRDALADELGVRPWLHVDGTHGAMAAAAAAYRHVLAGAELADSLAASPHTWLPTPVDTGILLVGDPGAVVGAVTPTAEDPTDGDGTRRAFPDADITLGRRARALRLWAIIRYFGAQGLAARIESLATMAREAAAALEAHPDLELVAPVELATICFRASPAWIGAVAQAGGPEPTTDAAAQDLEHEVVNRALLDAVNDSGEATLSHTFIDGDFALRLVVGSPRATPGHLAATVALITRCLEDIRRRRAA